MTSLTDTKSIAEVVRGRMDSKIAELLPDELFEKLLESSVEDLMHVPKKRYDSDPQPISKFQKIILDIMEQKIKEKVLEAFSTEGWQHKFDKSGELAASDIVKQLVSDYAALTFQSMVAAVAQHQVHQVVSDLRNGLR